MADEDLYGDLSGIQQDTQPASTSAAAPGNVLAPAVAEKDLIKQEDAPAAQHVDVEGRDPVAVPATDRGNTPQVEEPEEGPPEALAVEDAFARIAEVVGKQSDSPKDVVLAVSSLASQVDAYRTSTAAQHQQHMAQHIQIADLMATVLKARREAAEAKLEMNPSIVELRKMHCDPAIAREFELLKAENKKLQQEASRLREQDVANKFEVRSQKGRQLVLKLKEVQEENVQLERELQGQDAALRQAELHAAQLAEVQTAAKQMLAHNRMLQLQVEDAVAQAATLRKSDGSHSSFQLPRSKRTHDNSNTNKRSQRYRERHGDQFFGSGPPGDFGLDRWTNNEHGRPATRSIGGQGPRDLMGERPRHQHWDDRGGGMMQRRRLQ